MKAALYGRVSTSDKDQDPETQLLVLQDFCKASGWETYREYVDKAPANGLTHRVAWRELLDDAARKKFQVVLVFKLDRAFRPVKHMHDTLAVRETESVDFQSVRERFDASTALGRRQGKRIGRPRVTRSGGASPPAPKSFWSALERAICHDAGRPGS